MATQPVLITKGPTQHPLWFRWKGDQLMSSELSLG